MRTYKVKDLYIEAESLELAERIAAEIEKSASERMLITRYGDGTFKLTELPEGTTMQVWAKSKSSISYAGMSSSGTGCKIIQSALENCGVTLSQREKLRRAVNSSRAVVKGEAQKADVDRLESTIPKVARLLYDQVMDRIDTSNLSHKLEIINLLDEVEVKEIKEQHWIPLLTWFRDKVIKDEESLPTEKRQTFYMLRKSFATAAARIVKQNIRNANTMKLVATDRNHDSDFWAKYAKKLEGS
jgi:hypothetical protein